MIIVIILQALLTIWLIRYLLRHDRGPKEPKRALIFAGLLGVFAVIIGSFLEAFIIPAGALPTANQQSLHVSVVELLLACLAVGIIEEGCKALPLKRFLYHKPYFDELSDGIIYFGIAGMFFGALETIGYALTYGSQVGLARLITVPFMHAGFTSIVGYAIARQKVLNQPAGTYRRGFILAILLHATYDFGLLYGTLAGHIVSLAITVIANFAVFYLYRRALRPNPIAQV